MQEDRERTDRLTGRRARKKIDGKSWKVRLQEFVHLDITWTSVRLPAFFAVARFAGTASSDSQAKVFQQMSQPFAENGLFHHQFFAVVGVAGSAVSIRMIGLRKFRSRI